MSRHIFIGYLALPCLGSPWHAATPVHAVQIVSEDLVRKNSENLQGCIDPVALISEEVSRAY